jgi:hypothetical protein
MKKLIITTLLIFIPLAAVLASEVLLPTGQFEYKTSEVTHLREVRVFSTDSDQGIELYERLKKKGYICREIPVKMSRCYKFLENIGSIEIPLQEVMALTPKFGEEFSSEVLWHSSYLIKLRVTQSVETPYGKALGYELHLREGDDQFLEINFQNEAFYYQFNEENLDTIFLRRTYRKRTGDSQYHEYGVRSIYKKL